MPNWEDLLDRVDDAPPPQLAGYQVERLISERGQGQVYLAHTPEGERVAIKRWKLPTSRAAREARALASLDHPNVVRVLGSAVDDATGLPCVIMDYVDAPPLLARGALSARRAVEVVRDVARALAYVHGQGLVHRDVKPGNVLLRESGTPVLVDFGVVLEQRPPVADDVTATGARALGTRPFMAPEQLGLLDEPVTATADVYALGVTLYQCLTAALPFESDAAYERRERDVWRAPATGAQVVAVDPELRAIVSACLAFAPADRTTTASELADALEGWLAGPPATQVRWARNAGLAAAGLLGLCALAWATWPAPAPSSPATPPAAVAALHTLVLQPGPLAGCDSFVDGTGYYKNDNFGADQGLRVGLRPPSTGQAGEQRSFVRFDLSRLPADAEVEQATLVLCATAALYSDEPSWIEARAVIASGRRTPWVEGTGLHDARVAGVVWDGEFAGQGDPRSRSARPDLTQPDVAAVVLDRVRVPVATPSAEHDVHVELTAAVRAWVADPASNFGLRLAPAALLSANGGTTIFHSSDSVLAAKRPRLILSLRGTPPLPEPDSERAQADAKQRAETLLAECRAQAERGEWEPAFASALRAVQAAPFSGQAFVARGLSAERCGWAALARLDVSRGLSCDDPALGPEVYAAVARLNLGLRNPQARVQGLGALTALACAERMSPRVTQLYRSALPSLLAPQDRSQWPRYAGSMLEAFESSRLRAAPEAPLHAALPFLVAWVHAAAGDPRAGQALQKARAAWPGHALAHTASPLPQGPQVHALPSPQATCDWSRVLLATGAIEAAQQQIAQGVARWPKDPELRALAGCLSPR